MTAIVLFLCRALGFLGCPFRHGIRFLKSIHNRKYKNVVWVLAGICAAVPVVIILSILLATADRVFESVLSKGISEFLNPFTVIPIVFQIFFGIISMYCLICSAWAGEITEEVTVSYTHLDVYKRQPTDWRRRRTTGLRLGASLTVGEMMREMLMVRRRTRREQRTQRSRRTQRARVTQKAQESQRPRLKMECASIISGSTGRYRFCGPR